VVASSSSPWRGGTLTIVGGRSEVTAVGVGQNRANLVLLLSVGYCAACDGYLSLSMRCGVRRQRLLERGKPHIAWQPPWRGE
jgi:hypothetical protein